MGKAKYKWKDAVKVPDYWGSDSLTQLLNNAFTNCVATIDHFKDTPIVNTLRKTNDIFYESANKIDWSPQKELLIPVFLGRAHGAYLASVRLALSGQVTEAYMVSRGCLENGLYASYIKADPTIKEKTPKRTKIWMERDENEDSLRKFRKVFSANKVLKSLEEIDSQLGHKARKLYEFAIRQGAHPNIGGLVTTSKISLKGGTIDLLQRGDQLTCKICVQTITQVGVCCLKIFTLVADDRVIKPGIHSQIEGIEGILEGGILKNDSR